MDILCLFFLKLTSRIRGRRARHGGVILILICVGTMVGGLLSVGTAADTPLEYQVKAAFLYNFAKFVEWPAAGEEIPAPPIRLCVYGNNPFGRALDKLAGKTIKGRRLEILPVTTLQDVGACHMLFVSLASENERRLVLQRVRHWPVLTVSDTDGFCAMGGIINFILVDKKIRFEVNVAAADRAGLRISSQLLKLARIVTEQNH